MKPSNNNSNSERSKEFLDLMIDKAHQTYYETGKTVTHAFFTWLILLSLEVLLVIGMGADDTVSVPLLQVSLKRAYAAIVILILYCCALYWFYAMRVMSHQLGRKLKELLHERYGSPIDTIWFIGHPLPHWAISPLIRPERFKETPSVPHSVKVLSKVLGTLLAVSVIILPFVFTWQINRSLNTSLIVKVITYAVTLLLLLPTRIAMSAALLSFNFKVNESKSEIDGSGNAA